MNRRPRPASMMSAWLPLRMFIDPSGKTAPRRTWRKFFASFSTLPVTRFTQSESQRSRKMSFSISSALDLPWAVKVAVTAASSGRGAPTIICWAVSSAA